MRAPTSTPGLPRPRPALVLLGAALVLSACPAETPPPADDSETEMPEPICLDTEPIGEDIVINFNSQIDELQLGECVPARILITGGGINNLTGLSNLRQIAILEIRFAPMLTTLSGLENLERVDTLIIKGNSVMPMLPAFNDLETLGHVDITGNDGLTDLGSFPNVTSLASLDLSSNDDLTDYSGFEELIEVSGKVTLSDAAIIEDFTGLEQLADIGGDLWIEDNAALASFDGLGVTHIGGALKVISNPSLSECLVMDFADAITVEGAKLLSDNEMDLCN